MAASERIDEAIVHFLKALQIKPDNAEAHNNLGFALAGRGRIDEAIAPLPESFGLGHATKQGGPGRRVECPAAALYEAVTPYR